jgi:hypothetical protein
MLIALRGSGDRALKADQSLFDPIMKHRLLGIQDICM